jgi:RNA polymerase sigma factor (sigma-70 family)
VSGLTSKLVQQLRGAVLRDEADLTDGQLLGGFVERRDEAAFAALLHRHGPMVLGVCRRLLHHAQDVEDAFQATFLVLVRKAAAIRSREAVSNWLYGVAYHTALKARALAAKRKSREAPLTPLPEPATPPPTLWLELVPLLDQELSRLPDKYRVPVVLCDLEGRTRKEAAAQLDCPEGTISSRLNRARALLAKRLARHGTVFTPATLVALLSQSAGSAGVPLSLRGATLHTAGIAAGHAAASVPSTAVAALTEGVLKTMFLTKLKTVTAVLLLAAVTATFTPGVFLRPAAFAQQTRAGQQASEAGGEPRRADEKAKAVAPEIPDAVVEEFLQKDPAVQRHLARIAELEVALAVMKERANRPEELPAYRQTLTTLQATRIALLRRREQLRQEAVKQLREKAQADRKAAEGGAESKEVEKGQEDRIRPGDRLFIEASNTLPNAPVKGVYRVEPSGKVALGFAYGRVAVLGMTPEQAESVLLRHLRAYLRDPQVAVTRYDALTHGAGAGQGPPLERRVQQLEEEVRALRAAIDKILKQRRN